MTTHKSIVSALVAAQSEMDALTKNATNPHFRSQYADMAAVVAACLPALNKHGIALIQPVGEDEHGRFVETVLLHETGELRCRVPLVVSKNDAQGFGSALSYSRRYGLMSMVGLAPALTEDDDGNAATKAPPAARKPRAVEAPPEQSAEPAYTLTQEQIRDLQPRVRAVNDEPGDKIEALTALWKTMTPEAKQDARVKKMFADWKAYFTKQAEAQPPKPDLAAQLDDEIPED